ncbi:hypothetical protein MKW92_014588 [Papaver armeniacum]|nr:hypothetical protein MKW92_014900 [Papaver armeniacum]KAI3958561.1 hypothetical protein MKW92_014588 [Papaver armeniacum]
MSAPLRKMGSQFRRLDTKFISARNFCSKVDRAEEVPDKYEKLKVVAVCGTLGLSYALLAQKLIHGRVFNILGFPVGKDS